MPAIILQRRWRVRQEVERDLETVERLLEPPEVRIGEAEVRLDHDRLLLAVLRSVPPEHLGIVPGCRLPPTEDAEHTDRREPDNPDGPPRTAASDGKGPPAEIAARPAKNQPGAQGDEPDRCKVAIAVRRDLPGGDVHEPGVRCERRQIGRPSRRERRPRSAVTHDQRENATRAAAQARCMGFVMSIRSEGP